MIKTLGAWENKTKRGNRMRGNKHNPRYRYDCKRCKFSWDCGYTTQCNVRGDDPPEKVKIKVNKALNEAGLEAEFVDGKPGIRRLNEDV